MKCNLNSLHVRPIPTIQFFAELSQNSTRSFQRKLAEEETLFLEVLDNWRFKSALRLLEKPGNLVREISDRLGYANEANFERAFKRWTGFPPKRYCDQLACLS